MARSVMTDLLSRYPFWMMDVAPIEPFGLPVLSPLLSFSAITAPEITMETQEIKECNWHFPRKVVTRASIGTMTLQRGVSWYDSDFWRWAVATITGNTEAFQPRTGVVAQAAVQTLVSGLETNTAKGAAAGGAVGGLGAGLLLGPAIAGAAFGQPRIGGPSPRRRLLLIHFFARQPIGGTGEEASLAGQIVGPLISAGLITTLGAMAGLSIEQLATIAPMAGSGAVTPGPFRKAPRLPARAFVLHGCIPTRYKTSSDFDASSGEISIQELDLEVEMIEEISLAT